MQAIRRCHYASKAFFSTRTKPEQNYCSQRPRVASFLREVFVQNLDNIAMLLPKADLKFISLVAYNFSKCGIENDSLKGLISSRAKEEIGSLTPELAYDLALNLREFVSIENSDIYGDIFDYCQKYFYLFDQGQLKVIDNVFSGMGSQFVLSMDKVFENRDAHTSSITADVLDMYNIKVPEDELSVLVHPFHKIVEIQFKKSEKVLSLTGITHESWDTIRRAKNLINDNNFDFYFIEMGPLAHSDTESVKVNLSESAIKRKKKGKESQIDKFLDEYIPNSQAENSTRNPGIDYFHQYGRIALFEGSMLEWYTENFLKNNQLFNINEAERIVYSENTGLKRPNELETIIYLLNMLGKKDIRVLFSDLRVYDEINILSSQMSLSETKELFKYSRFLWLNEFLRWGFMVDRHGCPFCSKSNPNPPDDILNLISHKRYNFGLRERFMAKQIIDSLEQYDEHKNYVAFFGEDHIYEILRYICEHYSKQPFESKASLKTNEEKFRNFLRLDEVNSSHVLGGETAKAENTNKISMLMSLFQLNRPKSYQLPYEANIDWQLYDILKKEYLKFLSMDSFMVDTAQHWKKNKLEEKCYAVNLMFYKQQM